MSKVKKVKMTPLQLEVVSRRFSALSEPSRLALLQALQDGPQSVTHLMEVCALKQANVSKHLGILHEHQLVRRKRDGNTVRYEISDPMVFALCELVCGKIQRDALEASALFHPEI